MPTITPKDGPTILSPPGATARDRAIAKLMGNGTQQDPSPVQNANKITPEEHGAIMPPKAPEGQKSVSETPTEPPKEETKATKEEPLSSQYAVLARKEKALRVKSQAQDAAIKAKEDALTARETALATKDAEYETKYISKDRLMNDPWSVLAEAGFTQEQIANLAINQPKMDPYAQSEIQKLKNQVKAMEDSQKKSQEKNEQQQTDNYKQALAQIRNEASSLVAQDPLYETIKEMGAVGEVVDLIEKTFNTDGILLTVEEAAKEVEEYLVERAVTFANLKKVRSRLTPAEAAAKAAETPAPKQESTPAVPMKTLTNSLNGSRPMTARERAILAFKGELNKNK